MLNKGIIFTVLRAVKATDRTVYKQATFGTLQTANQGLDANANEANTRVMLTGPGGYGAYTSPSFGQCSWGSDMDAIGAGYDGSCGDESNLRVGRTIPGSSGLNQRYNVDIFVK